MVYPWRLWASQMQIQNNFQIKSLKNIHKCVRNFKVKLDNSKWLARTYHKKIVYDQKWKLKGILWLMHLRDTQSLYQKHKVSEQDKKLYVMLKNH